MLLSCSMRFARLDGIIKKIVRESGADDYEIFITGKNNFRVDEATIKPYKGHRTAPKPHHYKNIKDYFSSTKNHKVTFVDGYEADDAMSIIAYEDWMRVLVLFEEYVDDDQMDIFDFFKIHLDTVIASRDKDLKIRAGFHHEWGVGGKVGKGTFFVTPIEGMRWFFKQLLMGDNTDNIPGLYGVGKSSTLLKKLDKMESVREMFTHVQEQYEHRFGSYWKMFMYENARLLWMLRSPTDDIREDLDEWEEVRQKDINKVEY